MSMRFLVFIGIALPFAQAQVGLSACVPGAGFDHFPFCNVSLPVDARVHDLVGRIDDKLKPNLLTARYRPPGSKLAIGQPLEDLGVPGYYFGSNCIHSSMFSNCTADGRCSTSFPSGPSWAATFDRELMREMAAVVGREERAGFNAKWVDNGHNGAGLDCWGPVINMNRDPRWGRNGEGGAEDPYLMQQVGVQWTRGLQENADDPRYVQIAVTLKHFDANSLESSDGFSRHTVDANISKHALADFYWPAFKGAIRDAGAKGVMCSYNAVNGKPTCVDPLMRAAREAWGFDGYVTSDSDSVADVWRAHKYVATAAEASCLAVRDGGCDVDSGNTYVASLLEGVSQGHCAMADVDAALARTLRLRFELGLFDPADAATHPLWRLGEADIGTAEARALNLRAAEESLVLLRNPAGQLPLRAGGKLAVLGPHGNATCGLIQVDTGEVCAGGGFDCIPSPLAELSRLNAAAGGQTSYARGVAVFGDDTDGIAAAVAAAKAADAVVLALGIIECGKWWGHACAAAEGSGPASSSGAGGDNAYAECEAHDRTSIDLPPQQHALAAAVLALGKPTTIVLLNGGSVAIAPELEHANSPAVVEAFYPGQQGGTALANALFGAANRWGRLPYTVYPANWTDTHVMSEHEVATSGRTYRYGADDVALARFGTGLSLSTFALSWAGNASGASGTWPPAPAPAPASLRTDGSSDDLHLAVEARSTGGPAGDVVLQVFFQPAKGGVQLVPPAPLPRRQLFDFARLRDVAAGGVARAEFAVNARSLLLATGDGDLVAAPGAYELSIEDGSGAALALPLQMLGEQHTFEPFPQPK
eukprot:g1941.t1